MKWEVGGLLYKEFYIYDGQDDVLVLKDAFQHSHECS